MFGRHKNDKPRTAPTTTGRTDDYVVIVDHSDGMSTMWSGLSKAKAEAVALRARSDRDNTRVNTYDHW